MIRVLNYVFVVALLVVAAVWFSDQPGAVDIKWLGFNVNTTVPILLVAILGAFWVITLPLRFVKTVAKVPVVVTETVKETIHEASEARAERLKGDGITSLANGIAALAAEDLDAVPLLQRAASLLEDDRLTEVLLAKAAELAGDMDAAKEQYNSLVDKPETELAALYGLIKIADKEEDADTALQMAIRAFEKRPDVAWVTRKLFNHQIQSGLYDDALRTLEISKKEGGLDEARYTRLKVTTLTMLHDKALEAGDVETAEHHIKEANSIDPLFIHAAIRLARLEQEAGRSRKAVTPLVKVWKVKPHPDVAEAYLGLWEDENEFMLVQRAEQLVAVSKEFPESHLLIAKMALKARLWGQARKELDLYLSKRETTRDVAYMNAEFEEGGNQDMKKSAYWLKEADKCEPNPTWRCSECGAEPGEWHAVCPSCNSFGTYMWTAKEGPLVEDKNALGI